MYHRCLLFLTGFTCIAFAYDDLSKGRVATQSTSYMYRDYDLYKASNAVDRNIATCMRTREIGLNSPDKTVWWRVDLGGVYNIYSVNILFRNYDGYEMRQRGRFAGFSLCVSNTEDTDNSSLCYKDGPELPPLNFTTTCITSGRYVIFYNARLYEVVYPKEYEISMVITELCEVIVLGCKNSEVYGNNCRERCPTNCRDNVCHIQRGTCFGCKPGWTGTHCDTGCPAGWYGLDCKQQCSGHCKDNALCNHVTGQCYNGCAAGWRGALCSQVCEDGTYGYNCVHNCSGNCLNDYPCNRQTGHCEGGCKQGYTNTFCTEHCTPGNYGYRCDKSCSGHCLNNLVCDHIDGTCRDGCQDGYIGKYCKTTCKEGYYGQNCSLVCSSNCKTCKNSDGTCSCQAGWMGPNCSIGCVGSYGENCQYRCSTHCVNQTCNRFHGICQFGCESGYHGQKCEQEYPSTSCLSSGFIGASVSACVFIATAVVIFIIRRKRFFFSGKPSISNKESPYADIENQPGGASTYQELTVPENNKDYENLALK
uniref:Protein draper-like isoform X1 n=3 Tax=Crassostrea virginica TaxID=6565 RepID=A0A8B8BNZ1_CRAVI|nr:protein draper-like isoform X1 [Crassostrea virginica]